jgi:hypothetical protein
MANGSVTFNLPRHLLTRNEDDTFFAPHAKAASIMSFIHRAMQRENKAIRKRKIEESQSSAPTQPKKRPVAPNTPVHDNKPENNLATSGTPPTAVETPKKVQKSTPGLSTFKPLVEKHVRQAATSLLATIDPNASLAEKRAKLAELKLVGSTENVKKATPEEIRFLPTVFKRPLKEWQAGLEEGLLLLNQPPLITETVEGEKPNETEKRVVFGPVPKLDPEFLVPALNGYSAIKMHTNQTMTTWDHHFRAHMQHVLAVAVGLAPCLGMNIPSTSDIPPKEIEKTLPDGTKKMIPNPAYATAIQALGEHMLTFLPDLQERVGWATEAAEGLNVLYENLRRQRTQNFVHEFKQKSEFKRIGQIEGNRFGEFLFDNDKEGTLSRLKKQHEGYFDNKAAATGIPKTKLMRDENFVWADAKTHDGQRKDPSSRPPQFKQKSNPNQGNGRGRGFKNLGRKPRGRGPRGGRGNYNSPNQAQWTESGQDSPGPSGQSNKNKQSGKRPWSGNRGGGNQ